MKPIVVIVFVIAICNAIANIHDVYGQEERSPMVKSDVQRLLSNEQLERERHLQALNIRQIDARRELAFVLEEATRNHRNNTHYMSPLHCAIQAVDIWRIYEAEDVLFSIIDYELDVTSLPLGIAVGGEYLRPAASALVSLRIDTGKVINAIVVQAENERQIRLLTWVLTQRSGSIEAAMALLKAGGRNDNLLKATRLLNAIEHESDLLQHPVEKNRVESSPSKLIAPAEKEKE